MKKFRKEAFIEDLMDRATTIERKAEVVRVVREINDGTHWAVAFDGANKELLEKKLGLNIPDEWTEPSGILDYIDVYFWELLAVLISLGAAILIRNSLELSRGSLAFGGEIFIPVMTLAAVVAGNVLGGRK